MIQEKETCKIQRMGFCFSGYLKDKGRGGGVTFRLVINPGGKEKKNIRRSNTRALNERRKTKSIPCFCMTLKNLTITLDEGLIKTCLLPAFSALLMALRVSLRTEVLTILREVDCLLQWSKFANMGQSFEAAILSVRLSFLRRTAEKR